MSYSVILSDNFKKDAKRLIKKYPSLKTELKELGKRLSKNPLEGTPLGNNLYKIRLSIASKGKGKSGGGRIISFLKVTETEVILLTIYNKGDKDAISDNEIKELLRNYLE